MKNSNDNSMFSNYEETKLKLGDIAGWDDYRID